MRSGQLGVPFDTSADAWFWTVGALRARAEGTRRTGRGTIRPCEPDDVVRCLDRLFQIRWITLEHAHVLQRWGVRQMPPVTGQCLQKDQALWQEAMARLTPALQEKGIVGRSAIQEKSP